MEDQLPLFSDFAETCKKVSKASGPSKSRAQVIKAKLDKAEKAEKRRQANLLKEAKPQLARQGVTACDLTLRRFWDGRHGSWSPSRNGSH